MGKQSIEGIIENTIYYNEDNGYTVFSIASETMGTLTCVGTLPRLNKGESIKMWGDFIFHASYGEQFAVETIELVAPKSLEVMEKYLSSGLIKGIGEALAKRIVKFFEEDTFRMIEEEPERLMEIKGISERKAREIAEAFYQNRQAQEVMIYLQQFGISPKLAVKIFNKFGPRTREIIANNPYHLAETVKGIGFKTADEIGMKLTGDKTNQHRIRAGVTYLLRNIISEGHIYMPLHLLEKRSIDYLEIDQESFDQALLKLRMDNVVTIKEISHIKCAYLTYYYQMELGVARKLLDLAEMKVDGVRSLQLGIEHLEDKKGIELHEIQKEAIIAALHEGALVITGGPGTGKTTIINFIIDLLVQDEKSVLLAAPTGRAAKRMTESTGYEALTIHRLLEIQRPQDLDDDNGQVFLRNEDNPLEADVIIIDEMSMVDIFLMYHLLKAIPLGTKVILVGDKDQLPSVGPGKVLKDIINSEQVKCVSLNKIFRQSNNSQIVVNAHKINEGSEPVFNESGTDFFLMRRDNEKEAVNTLVELVTARLPKFTKANPKTDIQILAPMKKGLLGVINLNKVMQEHLNPPIGKTTKEIDVKEYIFRIGDKVMQIRNNYNLPWELLNEKGYPIDEGLGVFNGETGIISEMNDFSSKLTVLFDDGKKVAYDYTTLDDLELAYAVTIHKSQGSEYPIVIMPLLNGPAMLFNRNLLYTGVTRAKQMVVLVGKEKTIQDMINNTSEIERYTSLAHLIKDLAGAV